MMKRCPLRARARVPASSDKTPGRTTFTSATLLGFGALILLATPAPAKATRPLLPTEIALKNLKMSMPIDMKSANEKNLMGLDMEDPALTKLALKQARDYIAYRKGSIPEAKWDKMCAESDKATNENAFCRYENDRTGRTQARAAKKSREDRREIAAELRNGAFGKVADHTYQDIVYAVGHLGDVSAVKSTADKVLAQKDCVPPGVSAALAYKLEENFPDKDLVETAKKLYKKSSDCGSDLPAATASFRLGLIQVWQNSCTDIKDLMLKVEKTPEASQYHARAKYWRFYCSSVLKDEVAKKDAKDALLRDHPLSFQNLAVSGDDSAVLSQVVRNEEPQIALRSLIRPDMNSFVRGVEALIKEGSNHLAAEMLDRSVSAVGSLEPEVRLYTAVLLNRIGYALPKFKILSGLFDDVPRMVSSSTMRLYFPLWYFDLVKSKEAQIDPLLILSLIRQESAFNKEARSIVGARGLMQVMPATAKTIARVQTQKLFDPVTNIDVGTKYLLKRLHQYGGDVELTLAAYNAGFARVDQWKRRYPTDNKMLFLDFIPFRETRDYVSMILRNYYWYVTLYTDETQAQARKAAAVEGPKVDIAGPKVIAIMNANAGLAAGVMPEH